MMDSGGYGRRCLVAFVILLVAGFAALALHSTREKKQAKSVSFAGYRIRNDLGRDVILKAVVLPGMGEEGSLQETQDFIRNTDSALETLVIGGTTTDKSPRKDGSCLLPAGADDILFVFGDGSAEACILMKSSEEEWTCLSADVRSQCLLNEAALWSGGKLEDSRIGPIAKKKPIPEPEPPPYLSLCLGLLGISFLASAYYSFRWFLVYTARRQIPQPSRNDLSRQ